MGYEAQMSGRRVGGVNAQKKMSFEAKGKLPGMGPGRLWGISGESSLSFLWGSMEDAEQREEKNRGFHDEQVRTRVVKRTNVFLTDQRGTQATRVKQDREATANGCLLLISNSLIY